MMSHGIVFMGNVGMPLPGQITQMIRFIRHQLKFHLYTRMNVNPYLQGLAGVGLEPRPD